MIDKEATSFLGFVPAMVVQHILEKVNKKQKEELPEKQALSSVVMFADISGFTNLTETLSKRGPEGAEIIAFAINRYMELMVKEIGKSGGDIFKFAGDAMIVVWPPPANLNEQTSEPERQEQLKRLCRQAVQSAIVIQSKLSDINIVQDIKLSVKIGFGVGDFSIIYVGGVFNRSEYLPTGDPLTQSFECEHHASGGGETIISEQVFEKVGQFFEYKEIEEHDDGHGHGGDQGGHKPKYYRIHGVHEKVQATADALQIITNLNPQNINDIRNKVMNFIPNALKKYIEMNQEKWCSEMRKLSVMFVNIGIDLTDTKTKEGLNRIQKVMKCVQKCIYYHEGSLNKFLMDDKGSTLIVVFGMPPMTHQDDAVRACLCSFALTRELRKIDTKCSIGIASGLIFTGVVGTSGNRREYSVIGDSVNLAARIMGCACKDTVYKVICDKATMLQAENKLSFQYYKSEQFKGKSISLPIYIPLECDSNQITKILEDNRTKDNSGRGNLQNPVNQFPNLRSHKYSYPMPVIPKKDQKTEQDSAHIVNKDDYKRYQYMYGRDKYKDDLAKRAIKFMNELPNINLFLLVRGEMGMGKSLLIRQVMEQIYQNVGHQEFKNKEKPLFVVSSLQGISKSYKLNGMRDILLAMFQRYAQRKNRNPDLVLLKEMMPDLDVIGGSSKGINDRKTSIMSNANGGSGFYDQESQQQQNQYQFQQCHFDTMKDVFNLKQINYIEDFGEFRPNPNIPQDPVQKKLYLDQMLKGETYTYNKLVIQFFITYFERSQSEVQDISLDIDDVESLESSTMMNTQGKKRSTLTQMQPCQYMIAPLVICLEDMQNYDVYTYQIIQMIAKNFQRILFIGGIRETFLEQPLFQDANKPTQEQIFQEGIQGLEMLASEKDNKDTFLQFYSLEIRGLKMTQLWEIIKHNFNIDSIQEWNELQERMILQNEQNQQGAGDAQGGKGLNASQISVGNSSINHSGGLGSSLSVSPNKQTHQGSNNNINRSNSNMKGSQYQHSPTKAKNPLQDYKYLMYSTIKKDPDISKQDLFLNFLYLKMGGNPLRTIHFFQNLVDQKYIMIKDQNINNQKKVNQDWSEEKIKENNKQYKAMESKKAYMTPQLQLILEIEDLLIVDAPFLCHQINGPIIDKLDCLQVMILKIASVIGDVFDIQLLNKVQPFKELIKPDKLFDLLNKMKQQNLLELIDQTPQNIYYRFNYPFLRECVYQRLTYQQRRQLHLTVAEFLAQQPSSEYDEDTEQLRLQYHWSLSDEKMDIVNTFSHKALRSIIVKKITSILSRNQNNPSVIPLKTDNLLKKSDRNVTFSERYTILSSKDIRYYYNEQDFINQPDMPLAAIWLKHIDKVEAPKEKSELKKEYRFEITVSMWYKKLKEKQRRKFIFKAKNDKDLEEWTIYLDFAKAKAIYDDFVNQFGKIPFPISNTPDQDPVFKEQRIFDIVKKRDVDKKIQQKQAFLQRRHTKQLSMGPFPAQIKRQQSSNEEVVGNLSNSNDPSKEQTDLDNQYRSKIKTFLQKSMLIFFAHMFENTMTNNVDNNHQSNLAGNIQALSENRIGQKLALAKRYPQLFTIDNNNAMSVNSPIRQESSGGGPESPQQNNIILNKKMSITSGTIVDNSNEDTTITSLAGSIRKRESKIIQKNVILEVKKEEDEIDSLSSNIKNSGQQFQFSTPNPISKLTHSQYIPNQMQVENQPVSLNEQQLQSLKLQQQLQQQQEAAFLKNFDQQSQLKYSQQQQYSNVNKQNQFLPLQSQSKFNMQQRITDGPLEEVQEELTSSSHSEMNGLKNPKQEFQKLLPSLNIPNQMRSSQPPLDQSGQLVNFNKNMPVQQGTSLVREPTQQFQQQPTLQQQSHQEQFNFNNGSQLGGISSINNQQYQQQNLMSSSSQSRPPMQMQSQNMKQTTQMESQQQLLEQQQQWQQMQTESIARQLKSQSNPISTSYNMQADQYNQPSYLQQKQQEQQLYEQSFSPDKQRNNSNTPLLSQHKRGGSQLQSSYREINHDSELDNLLQNQMFISKKQDLSSTTHHVRGASGGGAIGMQGGLKTISDFQDTEESQDNMQQGNYLIRKPVFGQNELSSTQLAKKMYQQQSIMQQQQQPDINSNQSTGPSRKKTGSSLSHYGYQNQIDDSKDSNTQIDSRTSLSSPAQKPIKALVNQECYSIKGDQFILKQGEVVQILKQVSEFYEVRYNRLQGYFRKTFFTQLNDDSDQYSDRKTSTARSSNYSGTQIQPSGQQQPILYQNFQQQQIQPRYQYNNQY